MKRTMTFAGIAILGMAAKGLGCTTNVEPIAGPGKDAGPSVDDSATGDRETTGSSGASSGGSSSGGGGPSSSGSSGSSSGGYATLCPAFSDQPTCPAASDANGCNLSLGTHCAADELPQGLACSGPSQCQARIGPIDGCGRVDAWICSCIDGSWSCDDCALGATLCEGGTGDYDLPDGGTKGECPVATPADGSACKPVGLGCQYGSSWIDCNQIATCTSSGWSVASPVPSSCTSAPCPSSYPSGSLCGLAPIGTACWYPQGSCVCGAGGPATPDAAGPGWACDGPVSPGGCPYPAPAPESACTAAEDGQDCWYGGCGSSGPALFCTGGIWQSQNNACPL